MMEPRKLVFKLEVFDDHLIRMESPSQKQPVEKQVDTLALSLFLFNVGMMVTLIPSKSTL